MGGTLSINPPGLRLTGALVSSLILHGLLLILLFWYLPHSRQTAPQVVLVDLTLAHKTTAPALQQPAAQPAQEIRQPAPLKKIVTQPIQPEARPIPRTKPAPVKIVKKELVLKKPVPAPAPLNETVPIRPEAEPRLQQDPLVQNSTESLQRESDEITTGPQEIAKTEVMDEAAGTGLMDLQTAYIANLRQQIDHYKTYPNMARRGQQQGVVVLEFVLNPDGSLASCEIEKSSGFPLLDRAARKAVASALPFEPLPDGLNKGPLRCQLPLRFELTR